MARRGKFEFNSAGAEEILNSDDVAALVLQKAMEIAENVRGQNLTVSNGEELALYVEVNEYETDRVAAEVYINHPAGEAMQAKHGVLTKAVG